MKRLSLFATVALAVVMSALPAVAQETSLRVNVPFDFVVAGKSLPAGQYSIFREGLTGALFLVLRGSEGQALTVTYASLDRPAGEPRLTFNQYGDRYFLSGITTSQATFHFARTKEETRLAMRRKVATVSATGGR